MFPHGYFAAGFFPPGYFPPAVTSIPAILGGYPGPTYREDLKIQSLHSISFRNIKEEKRKKRKKRQSEEEAILLWLAQNDD